MRRPLLLLLLAVPLATVSGCLREGPKIETYDVEHPDREKIRLLGAILPHGDSTWFVKLMGPEAAVADAKKSFDDFVTGSADQKKIQRMLGIG